MDLPSAATCQDSARFGMGLTSLSTESRLSKMGISDRYDTAPSMTEAISVIPPLCIHVNVPPYFGCAVITGGVVAGAVAGSVVVAGGLVVAGAVVVVGPVIAGVVDGVVVPQPIRKTITRVAANSIRD